MRSIRCLFFKFLYMVSDDEDFSFFHSVIYNILRLLHNTYILIDILIC